jgi:hypothetical protein
MSEPQGAPAPVVVPNLPGVPAPTANQPNVPAPAATQANPDEPPAVDPKWLGERLKRATAQHLKSLGFESEEDAKAALEARRVAAEAAKTTEQKLLEAQQAHKKLERQLAERDELVAKTAAAKLAALTDAQRAAIEATAGKDPLLQLSMIEAFAPTWAAQAAAPAAPGAPAASRPAHTAAPAAPPPVPGAPKTDFDKWIDLKATDPVAASLFYQLNSMRIEQSRRT